MIATHETVIPGLKFPVLAVGPPAAAAAAVMIAVHGRGSTAENILDQIGPLQNPNFLFLAPQAERGAWYPGGFTAPIAENEPYLSGSLGVLASMLAHLAGEGVSPERTILLGFSQGACLVLEYAARNPRRYGGVVGFSGGLIGPDDVLILRQDSPSLMNGTPVFLGCSDVDSWIQLERVDMNGRIFEIMGAEVDKRIYPGIGHTIVADELAAVRAMMGTLE